MHKSMIWSCLTHCKWYHNCAGLCDMAALSANGNTRRREPLINDISPHIQITTSNHYNDVLHRLLRAKQSLRAEIHNSIASILDIRIRAIAAMLYFGLPIVDIIRLKLPKTKQGIYKTIQQHISSVDSQSLEP